VNKRRHPQPRVRDEVDALVLCLLDRSDCRGSSH
jgi:hypothetical protein